MTQRYEQPKDKTVRLFRHTLNKLTGNYNLYCITKSCFMKKINIRFLPLFGLLIMSFTIASEKGAFEKSVFRNHAGTCDQNTDLSAATYYTNGQCTMPNANVVCNSPHNFYIATKVIQVGASFQCLGGNIFCCAEYQVNALCPDNITIRDKLTKIICKE
jgi:hypothetical protein